MNPGIYPNLPNAEYHSGEGISKTGLDLFNQSPALVQWSRDCPRDDEVMAADFGDALHAILLEPDRFDREFIVAPECDKRTKEGKAVFAQFMAVSEGKTVLSAEEHKKLLLMRGSALAHPTARWLLNTPGSVEDSIYWIDEPTGELCRIRPDKRLSEHHVIVDVKSCDDIGRFQKSLEDYRYWFQDGMYSEGYERTFGEAPGFLLLVVQKTRALNRYPVDVFELTPEGKQEGRDEFRRLIGLYHDAKVTGDWAGVTAISRPYWATK
ncbi:MAG: PD-(D/E)XK nuclease-like domain-containing protein, partial [Burkholderiales bacterium]